MCGWTSRLHTFCQCNAYIKMTTILLLSRDISGGAGVHFPLPSLSTAQGEQILRCPRAEDCESSILPGNSRPRRHMKQNVYHFNSTNNRPTDMSTIVVYTCTSRTSIYELEKLLNTTVTSYLAWHTSVMAWLFLLFLLYFRLKRLSIMNLTTSHISSMQLIR